MGVKKTFHSLFYWKSYMCKVTPLQNKIRMRTNNGELIANFLAETLEGKHPDAKYHHKLEAAKLLDRYGFSEEGEPSQFWGLVPTPEELAERKSPSPSMGEGSDGGEEPAQNSPVTHLDILNYDIARLIRHETAEGHTIVEFLAHVLNGRDKPFTPKKLRIRHIDRMTAAKEILRRGHGHFGRRRKLVIDDYGDSSYDTNDYDTLHTDLAKRMREYSEHGTDAIRFLLDVMSDADPGETYSWHHRTSAAQELIRRGWDTNYEKITPKMLQEYWRDQQSTRLSVGQKKHLAGFHTFLDEYDRYDDKDYEAKARQIREAEDLQEAAAYKSRLARANGNPVATARGS